MGAAAGCQVTGTWPCAGHVGWLRCHVPAEPHTRDTGTFWKVRFAPIGMSTRHFHVEKGFQTEGVLSLGPQLPRQPMSTTHYESFQKHPAPIKVCITMEVKEAPKRF